MTTPRIVVTVAAPVEAVWDALRDKEKIRHWHGWEYDGLDAEIDLIFFTAYTEDAGAHVLEIQGGDHFELEPVEGGTRITLTGAPHSDDPEWDAYYDDITEGWITFLHQLKFALERHPDEPRRTLFYTGTSPAPIDEVGEPGTAYEIELYGETLQGQVWFRSDHQLGLTVDGWGDGLLVVSHVGPSEKKPEGASMAVLTFYGDVPLQAIDERWRSHWPDPAQSDL
jgi:uncharacterized protein YndB with AHSA1/START domain